MILPAIPEGELEWSYARAGGPGGQNVNKVSSKAVLRWDMAASAAITPFIKSRIARIYPSKVTVDGAVVLSSQEYREQERNRESCLEKLVEMIRTASVIPKPRRATKPSRGSKERRLTAKKRESDRKSQRSIGDD